MQLQTKNQKYTICLLVSVVSFFASALILSVSMALSICMLAVGLLLQHYYYN